MLVVALPVTIASATTSHQVDHGDTLSSIADWYGIPLEDLAAHNGIEDPDLIYVGQVLSLSAASAAAPDVPAVAPAPVQIIHVVEAGEFLSVIAELYAVTVEDLLRLNSIADANYIYVGQELFVPTFGSAPAPPISRAETEALLRAAADEFLIDQSLILGLAWLESGWNNAMVSPVGATGVMQLMPATAEWGLEALVPDAVNWETDTADNVRLGVGVFAHMLAQAGWDVDLALGFYYQGWRSIELFGMFDETYQYIANVRSLAAEFEY